MPDSKCYKTQSINPHSSQPYFSRILLPPESRAESRRGSFRGYGSRTSSNSGRHSLQSDVSASSKFLTREPLVTAPSLFNFQPASPFGSFNLKCRPVNKPRKFVQHLNPPSTIEKALRILESKKRSAEERHNEEPILPREGKRRRLASNNSCQNIADVFHLSSDKKLDEYFCTSLNEIRDLDNRSSPRVNHENGLPITQSPLCRINESTPNFPTSSPVANSNSEGPATTNQRACHDGPQTSRSSPYSTSSLIRRRAMFMSSVELEEQVRISQNRSKSNGDNAPSPVGPQRRPASTYGLSTCVDLDDSDLASPVVNSQDEKAMAKRIKRDDSSSGPPRLPTILLSPIPAPKRVSSITDFLNGLNGRVRATARRNLYKGASTFSRADTVPIGSGDAVMESRIQKIRRILSSFAPDSVQVQQVPQKESPKKSQPSFTAVERPPSAPGAVLSSATTSSSIESGKMKKPYDSASPAASLCSQITTSPIFTGSVQKDFTQGLSPGDPGVSSDATHKLKLVEPPSAPCGSFTSTPGIIQPQLPTSSNPLQPSLNLGSSGVPALNSIDNEPQLHKHPLSSAASVSPLVTTLSSSTTSGFKGFSFQPVSSNADSILKPGSLVTPPTFKFGISSSITPAAQTSATASPAPFTGFNFSSKPSTPAMHPAPSSPSQIPMFPPKTDQPSTSLLSAPSHASISSPIVAPRPTKLPDLSVPVASTTSVTSSPGMPPFNFSACWSPQPLPSAAAPTPSAGTAISTISDPALTPPVSNLFQFGAKLPVSSATAPLSAPPPFTFGSGQIPFGSTCAPGTLSLSPSLHSSVNFSQLLSKPSVQTTPLGPSITAASITSSVSPFSPSIGKSVSSVNTGLLAGISGKPNLAPLFADTLSASEPKKALPSFPNLFAPARSEAPLFNASTFNGLAPSGTSATSVASCTSITFANAAPSTATTATNGLGALVSSPIFGCGSLTASYNPSLSLTTTTTTVASNATSGSLQSTSGPGNLFSFGQQQQTNLFGSPQSGAFTTAFSSHGSQGLSGLFQSAGITPDATAAVSVGSPFSTTNLGMINSPLASTTSTNAVTTGSNAIQLPSVLSVFGSAPSIATSLSTVVSTAPSLFSSPKVGSNTPVSTVSAMSSPLSALTVAQAPALNIGLFRFGLQPATSTTTTTPSPLFTSPGPNGAAGATLTGIAPSLISPGSSSGLFKFGAQSQTLNSSPGNVPFMFGQAAPGFSLQPNIASVGPNATLTSTPPASNPFLLGCTTTRPGDSSLPGSAGIASTAQARRRTAAGARRTKRS